MHHAVDCAVAVGVEFCSYGLSLFIADRLVGVSVLIPVDLNPKQHPVAVILLVVGLAIVVVVETSHFFDHTAADGRR